MMRAADADILPYDFTILSQTLKTYDSELKALLKSLTDDAKTRKRNLDLGLYALTNDPKNPVQPPAALPIAPEMNFSSLDKSIGELENAAAVFKKSESRWLQLSPGKRNALNAKLSLTERRFSSDVGLPRRPWVRNLLYAPGTLTGYGAKTMPGVREALEQMRFAEAKEQLILIAKVVHDEAEYLEQITVEFNSQ
ncbi:MAG TPA: transferrin receptor-like dimerization domain-containing protein [Bryobacteraceae bacterium]|nr:transferrin receptor-like dimerization domain-containing protein [Bryobacteraceae bacterium]